MFVIPNADLRSNWLELVGTLVEVRTFYRRAAHWFFLEIFVRKFKRGNQRVLLQNWVKNVGINKCSLSKNLKNGPKVQL